MQNSICISTVFSAFLFAKTPVIFGIIKTKLNLTTMHKKCLFVPGDEEQSIRIRGLEVEADVLLPIRHDRGGGVRRVVADPLVAEEREFRVVLFCKVPCGVGNLYDLKLM